MEVSVSEFVAVPKEKAFAFLCDFEAAPRYSHLWKSAEVLERGAGTTTYRVKLEVMGRTMNSTARVTIYPGDRIEADTIDGDGSGTKLNFRFQEASGGTQVTLDGDIVLPGFAKLLGSAVKGRIESSLKDELATVKGALEKS